MANTLEVARVAFFFEPDFLDFVFEDIVNVCFFISPRALSSQLKYTMQLNDPMFTDFKLPGIKPRFCELDTIPLTLLGKCYQTDTCPPNLFRTKLQRRNEGLYSKTFLYACPV